MLWVTFVLYQSNFLLLILLLSILMSQIIMTKIYSKTNKDYNYNDKTCRIHTIVQKNLK